MWRFRSALRFALLAVALPCCGARSDLADLEVESTADPLRTHLVIADNRWSDAGRLLSYESFEGPGYAELDAGPIGFVCAPGLWASRSGA